MSHRSGLLAACQERTDDTHQLLVTADWFEENGEEKLAAALRWMARWDKRPHSQDGAASTSAYPWVWTCYGGLCGPRFKCGTQHALPRALCRRLGFHEWRAYPTWEAAVRQLADALLLGPVDCLGDPEQVDEL